MSILTPEELALLEKNPDTAAVAKKLKESTFVPYDRFKEVNDKAKESADALKKFEDAQKMAEEERLKKQGEFQKLAEEIEKKVKQLDEQLKIEKAEADKYRAFRTAKVDEYKKKLGDDWLPEYDNFSLESLEKIIAKAEKKDDPSKNKPGSKTEKKPWAEMTPQERERIIEDAKAGKKPQV